MCEVSIIWYTERINKYLFLGSFFFKICSIITILVLLQLRFWFGIINSDVDCKKTKRRVKPVCFFLTPRKFIELSDKSVKNNHALCLNYLFIVEIYNDSCLKNEFFQQF